MPPGSTAASVAYCTIPRFSKPSYSGRQESLTSKTRGSPLAARGGTTGEKWWTNGAWVMYPGFFYMLQFCDIGPIILLLFRRKACWGFFYRPLKIRRLRPGLNPRTRVLKASTLPLHHRSRLITEYLDQNFVLLWLSRFLNYLYISILDHLDPNLCVAWVVKILKRPVHFNIRICGPVPFALQ